eukprot:1096420-Rhodomonas_salina.2
MMRAVIEMLKDHKIWALCLLKCMTDWLQVMDLVVNWPYKANTCKLWCKDLREYMQTFRMQFYSAKVHNGAVPVWDQPKPSITHVLSNSITALALMDQDTAFRAGMAKAFVQTGLVPVAGGVETGNASFCRWTGADPHGMLSARASGRLVGLLKLQEQQMDYLIDDSNMLEICNDEGGDRDCDLFEEDTEDESEEVDM